MSGSSKIEWTDSTWNPVRGCTKVSPGCAHCYAETFAERWRGISGHPFEQGFDLRLVPEKLTEPLKWKKPRRIFVNSMSDLFHGDVSFDYIAQVYAVMLWGRWHTFQVLTKRAERAMQFHAWLRSVSGGDPFNWLVEIGRDFIPEPMRIAAAERATAEDMGQWPLPNVWLGVSCEDQKRANERIPELLACPAAVRFVSAEPLLGSIDFTTITLPPPPRVVTRWHVLPGVKAWCEARGIDPIVAESGTMLKDVHGAAVTMDALRGEICATSRVVFGGAPRLDWVIAGGESGPGARASELDWYRDIQMQCRMAGTAFFMKQIGARPQSRNPSDWDHFDIRRGNVAYECYQFAPRDPKGGKMEEWPADLRVQEFPAAGRVET